ncbi:polymorphic toxin-type HINT domain-containing protein [Actinoplanes sp. RD1]|uniref:polymorphic toxin-type HINT domain-containing protein n=1 Tax=Actinoplanes sp. RD1 TaxID=3064538 RepID=UPI0027425B92|nr:polymorphic toxin-type HINT domain-containing protein [Actinoplanes sp. RD1]
MVLLTAGTAQGGTTAVQLNPRPLAAKAHEAKPAPEQRWGDASGLDPVAGGTRKNTWNPQSLRAKYPLRKTPQAPANVAEVKPAPAKARTGFQPGASKELPAERGAHERTYANADGTQTTQFSATPLNYRKADGTWAPVDSTLRADPAGGWQRATDAVPLHLAKSADAAELVRVTLPGGGVLAYGAEGAAPAEATVSGDTASYRQVWPGVDVELQAQAGGVKETLVLGSARAPDTYVFPLRLTGLTATLDKGTVLLRNGEGATVGTIPAGYMVDAKSRISHAVSYTLGKDDTLRVTVDRGWLTAPERAFPVRVDPPVLANGAATESLVVSSTGSRGGGDTLEVGKKGSVSSASYVRFPGLVSSLAHETIFNAQLSLVGYDAPSCKPRPVTVHPVTGSWSSSTSTTYPGPAVGAAIASKSFAQGYVAVGQSASSCPVTGTVFDLGTKGRDLVQGWVDGKADNGLSLRAPVSDTGAWKTIAGPASANPPTLYVTHTPYNAKYSIPDPTPKPAVLQNQAGKVKVTVTNKSAMDWSTSGYRLVYRLYNAKTNARIGQYVAGSLTSTLARGATTSIEATIKALPIGDYLIDFSMATSGGKVFTDENVPPARIGLAVRNIDPTVQDVYPPNGYQSPTLTPQLWAQAIDLDAPPKQTLQYKFEYCATTAAGDPTGCTTTAYQAKQSYTIPAGKLSWSKPYVWRAFVKDNASEVATDRSTLITTIPQPEITSRVANAPYGTSDREFDPDIGNYSTAAVDATVATAGPALSVARTYNSLDPRRDLLFGEGWMTQGDMRMAADADGSGNVLITYPDGQQVRFGKNADGTFAAPLGRTAQLSLNTTTNLYVLKDVKGTTYSFRSGGDGKIASIADKHGRLLQFTYTTAGQLAKMQAKNGPNATTGRALTFGWNSTNTHVTSVSTDKVDGRTLTWTYEYTGDTLTKVCAPGAQVCTRYAYSAGSHYRSSVLDSDPDSYWRLGEKAGSASAGSEIVTNLGKDAATVKNATLGAAGALAGTENTGAQFNGSTSVIELPRGVVKRSRDIAVELWFKVGRTETGGPLIGYQDTAMDATATSGVPLLYVGTDGKVYGRFKTTSTTAAPLTTGPDIRDGAWHHAALSVSGDVQTLYVDKVKVSSTTLGALDHSLLTYNQVGGAQATTGTGTWTSYGSSGKRYFNGGIDEVAVYGHALSDQTVAAHYGLGKTAADQLASVTMPSGKTAAEAVYDTDTDRIKEYTDGNGGTWKIGIPTVYGGDTDLRRSVEVLDPADRRYLYEYDALAGRLLRSASPLGIATRPEDQPLPSAAPSPSPTEICSSPDPGDPQFCTTIPGDAGGPIFDENELTGSVLRSFGYDDKGRQNKIVSETGDVVTMTFDDRGNVTSRTSCRAAGSCQTTYTDYTAPNSSNPFDPKNDLPVTVRDPRSTGATDGKYAATTEYTSLGDVASETDATGKITTTYTSGNEAAFGNSALSQPPGLVKTSTDAATKATAFSYTADGDLAQVTTPTGLITQSTFDALGRKVQDKEISDTFPDGVVTTYAYDDLGQLLTTTGPVTTNAVDGTKHQAVTSKTYDLDGNVVKTVVRDALDAGEPERVTTIEYDDFNHPTRTVSPEGDEQTEGWDKFGNRTSVVDGNGNHYEYAYTARNALAEVRLYDWRDGGADSGDDYVVLNSYAYDFAGRMAVQLDAMGRRVEYTYYGDDLLQKKVLKNFHDPDGKTRDLVLEDNQYDAAGNLTRQALSNGVEVTTNEFDSAGRPTVTTQDPNGVARKTTYAYNALGNVTTTTTTGNPVNLDWSESTVSNVLTNVYNAKGQLEQEKVTDGTRTQVTSYTYDRRGLALTSKDPNGNVVTYKYDENGDRTSTTAPAVAVETGGNPAQTASPVVLTGYNAFGEVVASKDALGNVSRTTFDRMGRVVESTGPLYTPAGGANTTGAPTTKVTYDALNNVVASTDTLGHVTHFTFDRLNRLVTKDLPGSSDDERLVWHYTYTRTGKVLSSTSPTGIRTEATYDDLDRQVTSTQFERKPVADTFTRTMTYDDASNVVAVTSPSGLTTTMTYDKVGDLLSTTDPARTTTRLGYDGFGNNVRQTDGAGRTTRRIYDAFGQVSAELDLSPAGAELRRETYEYDLNGNVTSRTSALKKKVTFEYNALDQLVKQVEPTGASTSITTTFGYDAAGNRTRYTDGRGYSTYYTMNALGLPESVIEPSTKAHPAAADRTWTVAYDLAGQATQLTAPGGVVRSRTYDAAGRLTTESGTGTGVKAARRGLTYDNEGRTTVVTSDGSNANTFSYDDRGNLLGASGVSGTSSFTYNDDGNLLTRTDAAGTATFGYKDGRVDTMKDGASAVTQTLRYDAGGMIARVDYGAGRVRSYGYDDLGRLGTDTLKNTSGATVSSIGYTYDLDDHLTGKNTTGTAGAGTNSYTYDDAGRLTSWTSGSGKVEYAWDDSGNRIRAGAKTATYDERNRLLGDGDYTYSYTARGTLAGRTSSGLTDAYSFDAFDRMVGAEGATYVYDGLDRVLNRNGQVLAYAGVEQDTVSDGKEKFARGPDGSLLAVSTQTDGAKMVVSDQHDDVVAGFGASSALTSLDSSTAYDPYGNRVASAGTQSAAGFQGDWTDPDTGQVDMGARFYDPGTGTFTSRDTVTYTSGDSILANKYTYGAGDPLSNNDPTGNWPSCGWCKRAVSAVVTPIVHAATTVYHAAVSAGSWLVNQARAAASFVVRTVVNVAKSTYHAIQRAGTALRASYDRYVKPTLARAQNWAAQKAAAIHQAAVRVKDKAKAAISSAVQHVSLKSLGNAVKSQLKAGLKAITISVAAALPAVTQSFSNVVQDFSSAAADLYAGAVKAGNAVVSGVQKAGDWVVDHKAEIIGGIAGAVVGIGCGALIGVTGVGAVACAAAGGAVGSLVTDLVEGGKGWKEMAADALLGGTIGAVLGPLSSVGGSAISGAARGLLSGGVREALSVSGSAATSALKSFGSRQVGGVVGKALANRSAGSAGREAVESAGASARQTIDDAAPEPTSCPWPNSFAPGTAVLMADGTTKPIEQVKLGDKVLATDPTTGRTEARVVTALIIGSGTKQLVDLTIAADGDQGTITATSGHPFWAPDLGKWVKAGELQAGSMLQTGAGTYVKVTQAAKRTAQATVHNLTVDGLHTYYVSAAGTSLLVHNACSPEPGKAGDGDSLDDYATANRGRNEDETPMFVSEYTSPSGTRYFGRTTDGGVDIAPGSELDDVLRGRHTGCAEVCALNEAFKAEGPGALWGGTFKTLRVRSLNSPEPSNTWAHPCEDYCQPMIRRIAGAWS